MSEQRPAFVARKNPGSGWGVDILWPDGETEVIKGFITEHDRSSGLLSTLRRGRKMRMPSHPERPRDLNQLATSIIDIATGEPLRDPLEPVKFPLITYADCFISALGPLYCEARSFIGAKEA